MREIKIQEVSITPEGFKAGISVKDLSTFKVPSFEEQFPSLKFTYDCVPHKGMEFFEDGLGEFIEREEVERFCLDKAKVREAFIRIEKELIDSRFLPKSNTQKQILKEMKELGL